MRVWFGNTAIQSPSRLANLTTQIKTEVIRMKELSMEQMEKIEGGDLNSCFAFGLTSIMAASAASIAGPAGLLAMSPAVVSYGQACFSS